MLKRLIVIIVALATISLYASSKFVNIVFYFDASKEAVDSTIKHILEVEYTKYCKVVGVLKWEGDEYALYDSLLSARDGQKTHAIRLMGLGNSFRYHVDSWEGKYVEVVASFSREPYLSTSLFKIRTTDISSITLAKTFPVFPTELNAQVSWETQPLAERLDICNLNYAILAHTTAVQMKHVLLEGWCVWNGQNYVLFPQYEDAIHNAKEGGIIIENMLAIAENLPYAEPGYPEHYINFEYVSGYVDILDRGLGNKYAATLKLHRTGRPIVSELNTSIVEEDAQVGIYSLLANPWLYNNRHVVVQGLLSYHYAEMPDFGIKSEHQTSTISISEKDLDANNGRIDVGGPVVTSHDLSFQESVVISIDGIFRFSELIWRDNLGIKPIYEWYFHPLRLLEDWRER